MCVEESDDQEAVAKLLEINDSIHRTIERYKLIKKGDLAGASKIPKGTLGTSMGVTKTADNELSLIDLGGDPEPTNIEREENSTTSENKKSSIEDDLLGLSVQDQPYGQGGGIALGFGANTSAYAEFQTRDLLLIQLPDIPGPSLLSSNIHGNTANPGATLNNAASETSFASSKPNYDLFSNLTSSSTTSQTRSPNTIAQSSHAPNTIPSPALDPFSALYSASPLPPSLSKDPSANTLFGMNSPIAAAPSPNNTPKSHNQSQIANGQSNDDDWNFSSALPDEPPLQQTNEILVSNTAVGIALKISRPPSSKATIVIAAQFSNNTNSSITEYHFQLAVTKVSFTTSSNDPQALHAHTMRT